VEAFEESKHLVNVQSVDGSYNDLANRSWRQSDIPFLRVAPTSYADGKTGMSKLNGVGPSVISHSLVNMEGDKAPVGASVSDMFWQWVQFLDSDF
jgi:hypothetical protein